MCTCLDTFRDREYEVPAKKSHDARMIVNTYVVAHDLLRCLKNRRENRRPKNRTMIGVNVT